MTKAQQTATKAIGEWVPGSPESARQAWRRRRRYWIICSIGVSSVVTAIDGGILYLLDEYGTTLWDAETRSAIGWALIALIPASGIIFAIVYLYLRMKGKPQGLLGAPTSQWAWAVAPYARPDGADSDGEAVPYDITYLLFTPDVNRTIILPARNGDTPLTCSFTISNGYVRFDGVINRPPVQRRPGPETKLAWLEPDLAYDENSAALLVPPEPFV